MAKGHDAVTRCDNCSGACYAPCTRGAVTLSAPERIQPAFTGVEKYGVRSGMNIDAGVACGVVGLAAGVPAAGATLAASAERGVRLTHGWWLGGGGSLVHVGTVAAATGVTAAAVGVRLGWSLALPAFVASAVIGVVLAVIDMRQRRLPYVLTVPMYALCLISFGAESILTGDYSPLVRSALAGAATFAGFLLLALMFAGQLGLGDVVLTGWLAMCLGWLGWDRVALGLLAGLILQALVGAVSRARDGPGPRRTLPMGPALVAGWLVGIMVSAS